MIKDDGMRITIDTEKEASEDTVYIVYKAWSDPLENDFRSAFGYSAIGFVKDPYIVDEETTVGEDFCWACNGSEPTYKIIPLRELQIEDLEANLSILPE